MQNTLLKGSQVKNLNVKNATGTLLKRNGIIVIIKNGTIIIRNGRIDSVFEAGKIAIPPDCQVRAMDGKTIYAGFIDPYLSLGDDKLADNEI